MRPYNNVDPAEWTLMSGADMTTPILRGYLLKQTVSFIESQYFDPATCRRIMGGLPANVAAALPNVKPAEWYPREYLMAMLRGVASVKSTDQGAYEDLVAYGTYVAQEATNTFLKLLLRILTPTLLAKKVPEIWARDHQGSGRFEIDLQRADDGLIKLRLVGAKGFDHIGITSIGFITHSVKTMGKKNVQMTQTGWSLATPSPDEISYELKWT